MPEIISLLSSPPDSPLKATRFSSTGRSPPIVTSALPLHTDDFEFSGDLDFPHGRPAKKQKVNSGKAICSSPPSESFEQIVELDLSSDVGLPEQPVIGKRGLEYPSTGIPVDFDNFDEIVFSSSAPEPRRKKVSISTTVIYELSSDGLSETAAANETFSLSQPVAGTTARTVFSDRTANILANLGGVEANRRKSNRSTFDKKIEEPVDPGIYRTRKVRRVAEEPPDDIVVSSSPKKAENTKETRALDRCTVKSVRAAEKELAKAKIRDEREAKAKEKQKIADIAEANKSKTNKKESVTEMIVEASKYLENTTIGNQLEEYMKQLEVPITYFDEEENLSNEELDWRGIGNVVRWRRKTRANYDKEAGHWVPTDRTQVKSEEHVLVQVTAVEFATVLAKDQATCTSESSMKAHLDSHIAAIRHRYKDCTLIYLIQGLQAWLKRHQNTRNREYTAAVRAQMLQEDGNAASSAVAPSSSQAKTRKRKTPALAPVDLSFINSDLVEDLLLHLQLVHQPIVIQHTTSPATTAAQISAFTQHLSTRPYRLAQLNHNLKSASFCMDTGQVRTGDNAQETFIKMLQEIQRVTPSMAYGIVGQYNSVRQLVEGFRNNGNLMLEDVRKSANKDGAWSDRRLGPMISKRLFKVFMGRDPAAMDGMA